MAEVRVRLHEIEVISFYYEIGKSGQEYLRKEVSHILVQREITLANLKKELTKQTGIIDAAKQLGWSDCNISLMRSTKVHGKTRTYGIRTDCQVNLELPRIIDTEGNKLHAEIYPREVRFRPKAPVITLQVTGESSKIVPTILEIDDQSTLISELSKLSNSSISDCATGRTVVPRNKSSGPKLWPWNIKCGKCQGKVMLRFDASTTGRIEYFKAKHYSSCTGSKGKENVNNNNKKRQLSIGQSFNTKKKRRVEKEPVVVEDSDIENLSEDEESEKSIDSDIASYSSDDFDNSDIDTPSSPDSVKAPISQNSDIETIPDSEVEIIDQKSPDFDPDWRFLCIADDEADPVCKRLDKLIRDGYISKDQIFYKYLNDITQIFYDSKHSYDKDVIEFFTSIVHLGGESTFNFIRGPMGYGNKQNSSNETRMNLGGPAIETLRKRKAAYTTSPGVLKYLSVLLYRLLKDDQAPLTANTLVANDVVEVYPVAFSNDGTALKPAIQFDEKRSVNVGLQMTDLDHQFCKSNPFLDKETLVEKIIVEAVVSSVTSLDNDVSLPVAVEYSSKSGKSGDNMKSAFTNQIKLIQMCENCTKRTAAFDMVLPENKHTLCQSHCETCYKNESICPECSNQGQKDFIPSLRACQYCIKNNLKCIRRVVMVITVDCESGNKNCLKQLQSELINKTIDPYLILLSILPDTPHVLKTCKASFANWYLQLNGERGCLSIFYTLRNRSDPIVRENIQKFLKINDYVRNRDRQNPSGVLALCNPKLVEYIEKLGFVTHTIVPETVRHTNLNQKGAYKNISSVAVGQPGTLIFLCEDEKSTNYKARLHNPVSDIQNIGSCEGDRIRYNNNGLIFCYGSSELSFFPVEKKFNPRFDVNNLKSKKAVVEKLNLLSLPTNGTMAVCIARLKQHQRNTLAEKYVREKRAENTLLIYEDEKLSDYRPNAITVIDTETMYVSFDQQRIIALCPLKFNSIGLESKCTPYIEYNHDWINVNEIELMDQNMIVSHCNGVSLVNLESKVSTLILLENKPKCLASYQDGFLFSDQECVYYWHRGNLEVFAGNKNEEGSRDGTSSYCRFYQASGLAVEFGNVVYCTDRMVGSIKMITTLKETSKFLKGLKYLVDAFSVHEKHQQYSLKSLGEAVSLVTSCTEMLKTNIQSIRSTNNITRTLNGPEGSVSAATVESINLLLWGLKRLKENTEKFNYTKTNLLSCMTLTVENFHSSVNKKHGTQTVVSYAQSFAESIKESIKQITNWSAFYFTSRERWYPLPESTQKLTDLDFPRRKPSEATLTPDEKREMREWASINGAAVRQRSCRQETTMARAGTLPQNAYFEELTPTSSRYEHLAFSNQVTEPADNLITEPSDDQVTEPSDSDTQVTEPSDNQRTDQPGNIGAEPSDEVLEFEDDSDNDEDFSSHIDVVPNATTFLLGRSSRYGRSITFNRKYLH